MDAARANAWEHFCDRVLCDTSWPRGLWFAAVEDALTAALGADARLVTDYRADVAELLGLERAARGTYHDEQRVAQLEAQIKRLIELADATISAPAATVPDAPARPAPPRSTSSGCGRRSIGRWRAWAACSTSGPPICGRISTNA